MGIKGLFRSLLALLGLSKEIAERPFFSKEKFLKSMRRTSRGSEIALSAMFDKSAGWFEVCDGEELSLDEDGVYRISDKRLPRYDIHETWIEWRKP